MRYALWSLFAVAAGIVLYFTLLPGPGGGPFTWSDKFQHFAAYFVLSLIAGLAARSWREALVYAALLAVVGYILEIVQFHIGRSYDLADELANALGCAAGFLISRVIAHLRR